MRPRSAGLPVSIDLQTFKGVHSHLNHAFRHLRNVLANLLAAPLRHIDSVLTFLPLFTILHHLQNHPITYLLSPFSENQMFTRPRSCSHHGSAH